jgi:Kef-type K+ transport system membrane component KefB
MSLFAELSIIIGVAFVVSIIMTMLRQPLIIGHIITGLLVGPVIASSVSPETFKLFSQIGIAILLFTVGLNLSPKSIREFGNVSLATGIGQVVFTSVLGYLILTLLGFSGITAVYMAVGLAFSSTIIILKLISDKGDMETLYGKISIGFLLVQDFIAILILFAIPILSASDASLGTVATATAKGVLLSVAVLWIGFRVFPKLNSFISRTSEMLFLFATVWGIGIASLFTFTGFSIEIGALIAGISLSTLPSRHEIHSRMSPLRDFFIVIFFILLGTHMTFGDIGAMLPQALILSALVLIGNPLILMTMMRFFGYKKKTGLQTGFTVAQISEFSLILLTLGMSYGHVTQEALSLVTLVGIITIFGSTYLVMYSDVIYDWLEPYLGIFEKKNAHEKQIRRKRYSVLLFGGNRIGHDFIESFKESGKSFLVIDHNPELIKKLESQGVDAMFGDASNLDFLESIDKSKVHLVISTIPDAHVNTLIERTIHSIHPKAMIMVVSHKIDEALEHYEKGIDYVILPHFLGGHYGAQLVMKLHDEPLKRESVRDAHIKKLLKRKEMGQEHPKM